MMTLVNGATYRLINRADTSQRSLNVVANSGTAPASLANVCLWSPYNNDTSQQWVYKEVGGNKYFVCKLNQNVALDLFTGSSSTPNVTNYNAHVYSPSTTSYLKFEDTSDYSPNHIRIRLANNTSKYLTANQGSNGSSAGKDVNAAGNVYFYTGGLTDRSQDWQPVLIDGGGGTPGTEVVVTNMPNLPQYYGSSLTEYFHPTSGMVPGTFFGSNNGQTAILNKIKNFYEAVFGVAPSGIEKYAYSLFGSKTITSNPTFNNTYHLGVDINRYHGAPVKFAHQGKLIRKSGNTVAVYDAGKKVTYFYLHTDIDSGLPALGQTVYAGDPVGTQSYVGLSSVSDSHLHFEVRAGEVTSAGMPNRDLDTPLSALSPYQYM